VRKALNTVALSVLFLSLMVAAPPVPSRMTIPAIAKDARGAVVSIIMSGKDGSPIAQGSGFLISKDGLILTNYHVIESGSSATVKLPDGAFFAVDGLLAFDKARDVAIIKAHGEDFRTLTLGNSDQLQVGEEVVAIGNPLSLESTVSNGIVSGIRTVEEEGGKFLQVTTPISPGSSGGPLFNMAGEVVGITTLYLKGGENLNFAIPINDAKRLLLSKSSKVQALPNETEPDEAQTHDADAKALAEATKWIDNTFNVEGSDNTGSSVCSDTDSFLDAEASPKTRNWNTHWHCYDREWWLFFADRCVVRIVTLSREIDWRLRYLDPSAKFKADMEFVFNLHDIDPSSIKSTSTPTGDSRIPSAVEIDFGTTNDENLISLALLSEGEEGEKREKLPPIHALSARPLFGPIVMKPDYAPRFIEAFRTAVESCGGKSSAF